MDRPHMHSIPGLIYLEEPLLLGTFSTQPAPGRVRVTSPSLPPPRVSTFPNHLNLLNWLTTGQSSIPHVRFFKALQWALQQRGLFHVLHQCGRPEPSNRKDQEPVPGHVLPCPKRLPTGYYEGLNKKRKVGGLPPPSQGSLPQIICSEVRG